MTDKRRPPCCKNEKMWTTNPAERDGETAAGAWRCGGQRRGRCGRGGNRDSDRVEWRERAAPRASRRRLGEAEPRGPLFVCLLVWAACHVMRSAVITVRTVLADVHHNELRDAVVLHLHHLHYYYRPRVPLVYVGY